MNDLFEGKAIRTNQMYNLSPLQASRLCNEGAILVDIRQAHLNRYKFFDVPSLIFCPLEELPALHKLLPSGKPLIIADASGIFSPAAVRMLMENGFSGQCANLSGGLVEWEHAGLPVKINYNQRIAGQLLTK